MLLHSNEENTWYEIKTIKFGEKNFWKIFELGNKQKRRSETSKQRATIQEPRNEKFSWKSFCLIYHTSMNSREVFSSKITVAIATAATRYKHDCCNEIHTYRKSSQVLFIKSVWIYCSQWQNVMNEFMNVVCRTHTIKQQQHQQQQCT